MKKLRPGSVIGLLTTAFTLWWIWILLPGWPETLPSILMIVVPGFIMLVYDLMKSRAPAKRSERPTEAEDVTFDVGAAMERYMASRTDDAPARPAAAGPRQALRSTRPVFGRRDPPTQPGP